MTNSSTFINKSKHIGEIKRMKEKFKYAPSLFYTVAGTIWIGFGIMFFVCMFLIRYSNLLTIIFFINVIWDITLGIFYLNIHKRDYVLINLNGIIIDNGLLASPSEIDFNNIEIIRTIGNDIRIGLKTGKENRIKMNNLIIQDIERINIILKEKIHELN